MKRQIAAAGLSAAVFLSTMTACTSSPAQGAVRPKLDPNNPISVEIWHYYNGPQKTAFDTLVTEFNETVGREQGIIVEAFSQGNVDGLIDKVTDAAEKKVGAEEVPDIFAAYADTAYEVDKLGLLVDLSDYLTDEELALYRPEFISEGYLDDSGALKIFPVAKSLEVLMLNQTDWDKFAAATGASLDELATFEGVTHTAESYYNWTDSLTPEPDDGKSLFGRDAMANYFIIGSRQLGVELFQGSGEDVVIQADKTVLRRLWDNYYVPFINGWFSANSRFRSDDAHIGDIIALVGSTSGASYFPTEVAVGDFDAYPIDCTVLPAPIFEGGERYATQQGAGMSVIQSTPEAEYASVVFLKWFTDPERNAGFSAGSGYLPVTNQALDMDVIQTALNGQTDEATAQRIGETLSVALDVLDTHTLYTTRAFDGGNACRSVLESSLSGLAVADRQAVLDLMSGGLSHDEAVAQFDTDAHFDEWYGQLVADLEAAHAMGNP